MTAESIPINIDPAVLLGHVTELVAERNRLRQLALRLEANNRVAERLHGEIQGLFATARKLGCAFADDARVLPVVTEFLAAQAQKVEELEARLAAEKSRSALVRQEEDERYIRQTQERIMTAREERIKEQLFSDPASPLMTATDAASGQTVEILKPAQPSPAAEIPVASQARQTPNATPFYREDYEIERLAERSLLHADDIGDLLARVDRLEARLPATPEAEVHG